MKQFAVELKRTSYITIYVDAETKDQADFVRNYLEAHTTLVGETATGFVYLAF